MLDSVTGELTVGLAPSAIVFGVDEVGRGSWAGPAEVGVASISVGDLQRVLDDPGIMGAIDDSKKLSPKRRLAGLEVARAHFGLNVGAASAGECDELGLSGALKLAFERAVFALDLDTEATLILLDGKFNYLGRNNVKTVIGGDRASVVMAAASLAAKVHRDALMCQLATQFTHWHFEENKGYGSPAHAAALRSHGLCAIHRRSWRFVDHLELDVSRD